MGNNPCKTDPSGFECHCQKDPSDHFCPGNLGGLGAKQQGYKAAQPRKDSSLALTKDEKIGISGTAVLLLLVAVGVGVFLYMRQKKAATSSSVM